ncbi:MAG: alpha-E domain-containing protein [Pseudomonadota bacterium]|nr:alpha-E domain-containing protein [Pseudomonadota bacterium]
MLSRTADHLFWMARYMERAESAAQQRFDEVKRRRRAHARGGVLGQPEVNDAV